MNEQSTRDAMSAVTSAHEILQPEGWIQPRGYSNGIAAAGRQVYVSGLVGWNAQGVFEAKDLVGQVRQTLQNIVAVLAAGGARPEHIVRMTWYLRDKKAYVAAYKEIGAVYREAIGRHYPAMSAVQVADLVEDEALVEIEVTAVVPE
jgi:enamine deaminase RidA (YjgF/YER057c/UK114 family)